LANDLVSDRLKLSNDELWEIVANRDKRFYSSFVYGVKSSGIFCRPTCPSRRPSPDQVEFFTDSSVAGKAGYRACLRCRPESENDIPSSELAIQKVCEFIEENYNTKINLSKLAEIAGQSPFHFHRNFRNSTGVTPKEYVEAVRLKHAKDALKMGQSTRNSTYKAGHNSAAWLYSEGSKAKFGMTPSALKSGGQGQLINYGLADCSLGRVLVAATSSGICFVCLGDSDEKLVRHLKNEYPNAEISSEEKETALGDWISEIVQYLEGKSRLMESNLPVDVVATAFQISVWKELQKIPYGSTRSYNEIASRIGRPKAYRAVANACGSNRVPLVIPCHRVVRKNGDIGGYRWGIERKKKLLSMEAEQTSIS
jgi:AraC family transcriptional regulator, regulatory protein of adaptative response / methylated-DNA-[protein]-cysteine methyltransferase